MSDRPPYALLLGWMEQAIELAPTSEPVASNKLWRDGVAVKFSAGIPPAFTLQPSDTTANQGSTATFTVAASNATSYQWQKQESGAGAWANVSGAMSASYTTGTLTAASDSTDKYRCVATGPGGSTTSNAATLTVIIAPANTVAPAVTGTASVGQVVTCSSGTWTGTATITYAYQWQRSGTNISGATASSRTLTSDDIGQSVRCVVTATNAAGSVSANSNAVTPTGPTLTTLLFDEDFSITRNPLTGNTAYATGTGVGQIGFWNLKSGDYISGGVLNLDPSQKNLLITDWAANRSRPTSGQNHRIHYVRATTKASGTFDGWDIFGLCGSNPSVNNWLLGNFDMGFMIHNVTGDLRDRRGPWLKNSSGLNYDRGSYQHTSYMNGFSQTVEAAVIERRNAGSMGFIRINSGDWRFVYAENISTQSGRLCSAPRPPVVNNYQRLTTAVTTFEPQVLVQHSFASAVGPSDGTGQDFTGGSGVAATQSGSVTITGSQLAMSADGTGIVVFPTGSSDYCMTVETFVYDGSPCGPVMRYVDANNFLYVTIDSTASQLKLIEKVAGSDTTLSTINLNPGTTDTWNVGEQRIYWTVREYGTKLIVNIVAEGGSTHDAYIQTTSTRFASSQNCGVRITKGAGVNSATARNLIVYPATQTLPVFP